jgi:Putative collagen-binding domain of a collagenase
MVSRSPARCEPVHPERQDTNGSPQVRLNHDALERLKVGLLAEHMHPADGSVQDVIDKAPRCYPRSSWHGNIRELNGRLLSSTKFCLAQTPDIGAEYLVYAPDGGPFMVDLSVMPDSRTLAIEWFNPMTGETIDQGTIPTGSRSQAFTPPFQGDAVLYLADMLGHK